MLEKFGGYANLHFLLLLQANGLLRLDFHFLDFRFRYIFILVALTLFVVIATFLVIFLGAAASVCNLFSPTTQTTQRVRERHTHTHTHHIESTRERTDHTRVNVSKFGTLYR